MPTSNDQNAAPEVVRGFGKEWSTFRQDDDQLSPEQRAVIFDGYFHIFPWDRLPQGGGVGMDVGCGSGRWSMEVAPRVAHLHLLDASPEALAVARHNLRSHSNVTFHANSVAAIPLPPRSLDFAFSLGVLHHVPDTRAALATIAEVLKPGAPFLVYLYYAFDNRPGWFRALWTLSNAVRIVTSRLPIAIQRLVSESIAALIYWPLARLAAIAERMGLPYRSLPLSWYRDQPYYVMRTDAHDRFCTRLEQRFTRVEIDRMLRDAGFTDIRFSEREPFWCAVGIKARAENPPGKELA